MTLKSVLPGAAAVGLALQAWLLPAAAQTLFSDDLESGSGNWTTYPGIPVCTSLQYVSTATDPDANHTPGGSFGLAMSAASDRVYHDVDLTAYPGASVKLSVWFYDVLESRMGSCEPFDIRNAASTQVLGLGAWWNRPYYYYRILTAANGGSGPNWVVTSIPRTLGWHHFEIAQYRSPNVRAVEFFVDGVLVNRSTNVLDITLDRVVLGLGWANNIYQRGYVDDISFSIIPEPGSLTLATGVIVVLVLARRPRARPGER